MQLKSKTYIRIFFVVLIVSISLGLFSYSRKTSSDNEGNCDGGKCSQKNAHTEFILWESLTRNFLSASR